MATIQGTAAGDQLRGTPDANTIFGFAGNDRLFGGAGNDTVYAGSGGDTVNGEVGNNRLFGGDGDDVFFNRASGADGNDLYDGGAARDRVSYESQAVGVNVTLAEGGADGRAVQGGEVDTLRSIEVIDGSLGDDVFFGNSAANTFNGGGGSDRIFARGGDDVLTGVGTLDGGAGDDFLVGGNGLVRLFGGTGADSLSAGEELVPRSGDVDRNDLGSDAARDTFVASIDLDRDGGFDNGFGVERVTNFGAQDRLDIYITDGQGSIQASDLIDSDRNGVVNDADRNARLVGGNLVLDVDALFEPAAPRPVDLGEQHVILEQIASINADQFI